jgi:hypothetical protein
MMDDDAIISCLGTQLIIIDQGKAFIVHRNLGDLIDTQWCVCVKMLGTSP